MPKRHNATDLEGFIRLVDKLKIKAVTVRPMIRFSTGLLPEPIYMTESIGIFASGGNYGVFYRGDTRFRHVVEYFEPGLESIILNRDGEDDSDARHLQELISLVTAHDRVIRLYARRPELKIYLVFGNGEYADAPSLDGLLKKAENAHLRPLPFPEA